MLDSIIQLLQLFADFYTPFAMTICLIAHIVMFLVYTKKNAQTISTHHQGSPQTSKAS